MHFLRRYGVLKQRIADGDVSVIHVPDEHMPADFLTKFIPASKVDASVNYLTNSRALGATTVKPRSTSDTLSTPSHRGGSVVSAATVTAVTEIPVTCL